MKRLSVKLNLKLFSGNLLKWNILKAKYWKLEIAVCDSLFFGTTKSELFFKKIYSWLGKNMTGFNHCQSFRPGKTITVQWQRMRRLKTILYKKIIKKKKKKKDAADTMRSNALTSTRTKKFIKLNWKVLNRSLCSPNLYSRTTITFSDTKLWFRGKSCKKSA